MTKVVVSIEAATTPWIAKANPQWLGEALAGLAVHVTGR